MFRGKVWEFITAAGYSESVVSLKGSVVSWEPGLHVIHNNTPLHRAGQTMYGLMNSNIFPIKQSLYSSDLNLVESVWYFMKYYMQRHY